MSDPDRELDFVDSEEGGEGGEGSDVFAEEQNSRWRKLRVQTLPAGWDLYDLDEYELFCLGSDSRKGPFRILKKGEKVTVKAAGIRFRDRNALEHGLIRLRRKVQERRKHDASTEDGYAGGGTKP